MKQMSLDMNINNQAVTVCFDWYGEEPDWENMEVLSILPCAVFPKMFYTVIINDLLSDDDWKKIEHEIYWNEDKLKQQAMDQEY